MPGVQASAPKPGIAATVEQVTKIVGLFGIVCYITGLFITNAYLQSADVTDFSPLKVRFLYSGFTALICLGLVDVFLLQAVLSFADRVMQTKDDSTLRALRQSRDLSFTLLKLAWKDRIVLPALVVMFAASFLVQFTQHSHYALLQQLLSSIVIFLLIIFVPIIGFVAVTGVREWKSIPESGALKALMVTLPGLLFVGGLVYLLVWYAQVVLPAIPEQFGGTRPRVVRLLITDSQVKSLEKSGIRIEPGTSLTVPLKLIYESDEWITVDTQGTHISIDRKNVTAMKVEPGAK